MSLIKCKECKKELSSKAIKCPKCGMFTEYGKKQLKVIAIIVVILALIIVVDSTAILKGCKQGDEKRGSICVSKHYFDAQSQDTCGEGLYVKDGRCYQKATGLKLGIPTRKYYCNSGYLEENNYLQRNKCVVETTYNAYYIFEVED